MRELGGASGQVDQTAIANAIERRREILASSLAKHGGLPASPSGWTSLTGFSQSSGRVNNLLIHPTTNTTMWAGTDGGGIWKTTDGGTTWQPVNDFLNSLSITNLAMSSNDTSTMYAATNFEGSHTYFPGGVLKSTDGGVSWNPLAQTNPASNSAWTYVDRLAIHPTNSSVLLAGTYRGAYQSTDGGATWATVGTNTSVAARYVAIHQSNPNYRAIAYDDGTVRYTTTGDLGAGGTTVTVLAGGRYMKIAYAPNDPTRMYALVYDPTAGHSRVFVSSSAGGTPWTGLTTVDSTLLADSIFYGGTMLYYTGAIWVDPTNENSVAICEGWCAYTTDISVATPTWKSLYSGWTDYHDIITHPGYNGTTNRIV
jgi:hypothetical protein